MTELTRQREQIEQRINTSLEDYCFSLCPISHYLKENYLDDEMFMAIQIIHCDECPVGNLLANKIIKGEDNEVMA